MRQIEFASEPNWQPLRKILVDEQSRSEFMFMGTFVAAEVNAPKIELYKHKSNRRYLNIDSDGNCYFYDGGRAARGDNPYQKIAVREALRPFARFGL
jgi:hypothetical protein